MSVPTALKALLSMLLVLVLGVSTMAMAQDAVDPEQDTAPEQDSAPEEETSEDDDSPDPEAPEEDAEPEDDDEGDDDEGDDDEGEDEEHDGPVRGARVYGADRIQTAVAISQYEFRGGASEVYLARADNFADAVAAGSLRHGPVLLVPDCGDLPPVVAEEIARLHPRKVVALGGPAGICDAMLEAAIDAATAGRDDDEDDEQDDANDDEANDDEATDDEQDDDEATDGEHDDASDDEREGDDEAIGDDQPRTEETVVLDLAVGEQATLDAAEVGSVTIERTSGGVALVDATAVDDSWTVTVEDDEEEVQVRFRDGSTRVDLDAEVEDGQVRVRVRTTQG